jgi:hypothetical protein
MLETEYSSQIISLEAELIKKSSLLKIYEKKFQAFETKQNDESDDENVFHNTYVNRETKSICPSIGCIGEGNTRNPNSKSHSK